MSAPTFKQRVALRTADRIWSTSTDATEAAAWGKVQGILALAGLTDQDLLDYQVERHPELIPAPVEPVEVEVDPRFRSVTLWAGYDDLADRSRLVAGIQAAWGPTWQVEQIIGDTAVCVDGVPSSRPGAVDLAPLGIAKDTDAYTVAVHVAQHGLALIAWDPKIGEGVAANLPTVEKQLRRLIAEAHKVKPWDVELSATWVTDPITRLGRLDTVEVSRAPFIPMRDRRVQMWREIAESSIPGGSAGWTVEDDPQARRVTLRYGVPPSLPGLVDLADLMPDDLRPEDWSRLPLGVGVDGQAVGIDLASGPHALIVGPTGSGKTIALLALVTGALARGHDLVICDPIKGGADFNTVRPYCLAWADDLLITRAVLEAVYAEGQRRKAIVLTHGEAKWNDLPAEVLRREGIKPLTVLVDEFGSLVLEEVIPKGMDRDDPMAVEATQRNTHRAIIKMIVGKIARELRFVGVHLQIALQRPDVAVMGSGELRSNLTSAVQLVSPGLSISRDALGMVFNADTILAAAEQIATLDDGKSKGLAILAAEGGTARGLRVGYTPKRFIPGLLENLGVPLPEPWTVKSPGPSTPTDHRVGTMRPRSRAEQVVQVTELGELSFSIDDLERLSAKESPTDVDIADQAKGSTAATHDLTERLDLAADWSVDDLR